MDAYIRDYTPTKIDTLIADNINDCKNILNNKESVKNFKLFHNNIRSISKNIDELKLVLTDFDYMFDCIVLTETFKVYSTELFNIPGYDLIYNEGEINKNDGVIIYIRSQFNYSYEIFNLGNIKAIQLDIFHYNKNIQVIAIYRPPSLCPLDFNIKLTNYVKSIKNQGDISLIVGDMNLDILDDSECSHEYLNILSEQGYISTINTHTRVQKNSKSCLDHIFLKTNFPHEHFIPVVLQIEITDHYPVLIQFTSPFEPETNKKNCIIRNKPYINYNKLNDILRNETWMDVYAEKNTDKAADIFVYKLREKINICTKHIKIKKLDIKKNPWVTAGLLKSINIRHDLYKKSKKNPNNEDVLNEYKSYRNKLNGLINRAKINYYKMQIDQNKNSPQNMWKCVRDIQNPNHNQKSEIKTINNESGIIITDKKEIANTFCKYFSEIGQNLANKIKIGTTMKLPKTILSNSIYFSHTNEEEVANTINELKSKKSPGVDKLRVETIKNIVEHIVKPITYIINSSLDSGIFPSAFKIAVIKPLHKSGDKTSVGNYRPISLLSNLAKIFEKILKKRIIEFMNKYKVISDQQYGFRQARSTQDAMAELTAKIYKAMDGNEQALCIFVDLAKAFDTVSHSNLLNTLECLGFRGAAYDIMKSYLMDREQCVLIDNVYSDKKIVCYGVPQGTVLGPLLFTLYVNDLFKLNISGDIISFADDTAVFYKNTSWMSLKSNVENDFGTIVEFFKSKLLTINAKKTHFMPFTCFSNTLPSFDKLEIKCSNEQMEITSAKNVKYLGIIIDPHLRWNFQINNLIMKLRCLLSKFKYLKIFLSVSHLKIMYYSLVQSHLTYGIIAWGGVTNFYLDKLEIMQKWLLKIIYGKCSTYPSDDLYNESGVFDMRQLFCQSLLIHQHKNRINLKNIEHGYSTRYKENSSIIPRTYKTIGQRCHVYLCPKLYNQLPLNIKIISSRKSYKKQVDKWIRKQPRLVIHKYIDIKNTYHF